MMDLNSQPKIELTIIEIEVMKLYRRENIVNLLDCYSIGEKLCVVMDISTSFNDKIHETQQVISLSKSFYRTVFPCHYLEGRADNNFFMTGTLSIEILKMTMGYLAWHD
ncbi:unnamed protein product [Lymnaea stagnalis]|uniref:Uncharacterized protein n=1 Tax=Lymnaea stagnalis TaxID=6523 RepID=A0AAV2H7Y8_LYMST